jgi:DNA-binding NarL/FixJ family response regulator
MVGAFFHERDGIGDHQTHRMERAMERKPGSSKRKKPGGLQGIGAGDDGVLRALVVDDQVSVRQLVAELLACRCGFGCQVVGEASSGAEGLRLFRSLLPTLVVAALSLPEMNGAEMVRAMREERAEARVLVYTGTRNAELLRAGLEARPHGFVHKTDSLATLNEALGVVARGSCFFGPFATRIRDGMGLGAATQACRLTGKEREVLRLVAEGLSTKQVADRLSIAPKTAEHYRGEIMRKLELRDVASLTRYAVRCGLVES